MMSLLTPLGSESPNIFLGLSRRYLESWDSPGFSFCRHWPPRRGFDICEKVFLLMSCKRLRNSGFCTR